MGQTSDNLSSVFQIATEKNALLFFDEADTLLSRRISNLSQAADYGVNSVKGTLLTLLEKFNGISIFATNLFGNYDDAVLRRILFNIEFLPPDVAMRIQLWKFHLGQTLPKTVSDEQLAEISDGLCGGDIKNITLKLGLSLLTGKHSVIDEALALETIEQYRAVKERHKQLKFEGVVATEGEISQSLKQEEK